MTIAFLALALATSTGSRVPDGPSGPPDVVCATNLPHRSGPYCASPLISRTPTTGSGCSGSAPPAPSR
jgi:hypothetical protein